MRFMRNSEHQTTERKRSGHSMMEQLHEFPVLIEETNEVLTLFLSKDDMEKASQGYINILLYLNLFNV